MPTTSKNKSTKKVAKKTAKKAVKKTTKKPEKKAVKKTAKKAVKKTDKKVRALVCAKAEECFWTTDGQVLENLDQLQVAFGSMADEVFLHHVSKDRNDFADWVENVLKDKECAQSLRKARKPKSAKTVVVRCLKTYNL